jgi:DUF438 domain-containing protein
MAKQMDPREKKQVVKGILRALHAGLDPDQAAARLLKEAGYLTSAEIATIEEELLGEGVTPEEIQKFCNVHALIFEKALEGNRDEDTDSTSIIALLKTENIEIKKRTAAFRFKLDKADAVGATSALQALDLVIRHYVKKEQALFPFLEKRGFSGPSKVMWGKHDEVRRLLKEVRTGLSGNRPPEDLREKVVEPMLKEIEGMVEKEELILYPTALEKLTPEDLAQARSAFIDLERQGVAAESAATAALDMAQASSVAPSGEVVLPSGRLSLTELVRIFNLLPVDVSFVDTNDQVKYFSETAERIFPRARSVIGRKVQNCHPPKSLKTVERILEAFKAGRKDMVDFWINLGGKTVAIRYLAVRDETGRYLGTLEVSQDITAARALQGERRLLDETDF